MKGESKFPLTEDMDIDEEKKRLKEKYERVDPEGIRFWSEGALKVENIDVGDWLVWDENRVKQVDRIDIEEYEKYYVVQEIDRDVDFDGFLCYADMKLTQYSFEELNNLYSNQSN